eukprot:2901997-Lingulodinium_polyedra.AAC.1
MQNPQSSPSRPPGCLHNAGYERKLPELSHACPPELRKTDRGRQQTTKKESDVKKYGPSILYGQRYCG